MKTHTGNDFTTGDIKNHILKFAVPMVIGLFLTMGYNIINTIWIGKNELLNLMGTPKEIFNMASSYLGVLLFATFINYIYSVINSILSGMGDTKTSVIFLVLSTIVNAILDPVLIMKFKLNGAASKVDYLAIMPGMATRILDIGTSYLRVNAIGYLIFSISYVTNGIITGSGKTMVTMTIWYAILITYVFSATCSMFYYLSERYNENLIKYGEKAYN